MITYCYYNVAYFRKQSAMNNDKMTDVLHALKQPFPPSQVTWKPGVTTKDGTKALALAYADLRAYQNRLDDICGLAWSVTYAPWGERIVCHLTIQGITRSSSGEPDSQAERSEIAGTSAEAQAFKRACAMFGLGRYLYNLPSVWVEYDAVTKQFTDKAKAKLEGIIVQHYRRTMMTPAAPEGGVNGPETAEENPAPLEEPTAAPETTALSAQAPAVDHETHTEVAASAQPTAQTNNDAAAPKAKTATTVKSSNGNLAPLQQQFDALGQELYGDQWAQVSRHNIERITSGEATESGALTPEQIQKLVDGMKKLQCKRQSAPLAKEHAAELSQAVAA